MAFLNYSNSKKSIFKSSHSLEKRKNEFIRINKKFKNQIPVIIDIESENISIDIKKYLVLDGLILSEFFSILRKQLHINSNKSVLLFCDNIILHMAVPMSSLYNDHKDEDGFLYINIREESMFG